MGQWRYHVAGRDDSADNVTEKGSDAIANTYSQSAASIGTLVGFVLLLVLLSVNVWLLAHPITAPAPLALPSCACGSTASEAITNGCKFDPYGLAWLPDHCRDDELIETFTTLGRSQGHNWTFFTFRDAAQQLSLDAVAAMAGDPYADPGRVITTLDWHNSHCVYVLLHSFRMLGSTKLGMAERYRTEKHARHCARALMRLVASQPRAHDAHGDSEVDVYIQ